LRYGGKRYRSLADFKGMKVGTLVDSTQYKMIKALPGPDVAIYQDYFSLLADVRVGPVDLGVVDPPSVLDQIKVKSISRAKLDPGYRAQELYGLAENRARIPGERGWALHAKWAIE
jgi:polar amino acid transport system substrate-binding protein